MFQIMGIKNKNIRKKTKIYNMVTGGTYGL